MKIIKNTFLAALILMLSNCSFWQNKTNKNDEKINNETNQIEKLTKKKRFEPDLSKRSEEALRKGGGIFGQKKEENTFAKRNVMWTASLEVLSEMPIAFASYSGSIISTDWYQPKEAKESIKIQIEFKSNEVSVGSISVKSFKKLCGINENCRISRANESFDAQIKDMIVSKTRELNIQTQN